ncbi:MAG: LysM peptidoglycan-binding domain-containing protein [Salibacteraceae bacterium]
MTSKLIYLAKAFVTSTLIVLLVLMVAPNAAQAQYDDPKVTEVINGQKVYVHTVRKGQTLYGISKHYGVAIKTIVAQNPDVKQGVKPNQVIYIPVVKNKKATIKRLEEPKATTQKAAPETPAQNERELQPGERWHAVQPKETLFSLSRKYDVSVEAIRKANGGLAEGLKLGSKIVIPGNAPTVPAPALSPPAPTVQNTVVSNEAQDHVIQAGETRFSLSQRYGVSIEALDAANDNWPEGFNAGATVRIPATGTLMPVTAEKKIRPKPASLIPPRDPDFQPDTVILKPIYNVALLLPLYLDKNDTAQMEEEETTKALRLQIYPRSKVALDFYLGARMAVDSLEKAGMLVKFHVYDTRNDSATIISLLHREEMEKMNLFIGPLYRSNFELVAAFAKSRQINIVSPVHQSNRLLLGNPRVSKVSPSLPVQSKALTKYVFKKYRNDNLVLLNSMKLRDQYWVDALKRDSREMYLQADSNSLDTLPELQIYKVSQDLLETVLKKDTENVILLPSNNRAFVSEVMIHLNELKEDYQITIFGLEKWQNYDNLEAEFLHDLKVHLVTSSFVDYQSPAVVQYLRSYRNRFHTDPAKYSFLGFDVTYFYLRALQEHGIAFQEHLGSMDEVTTSIKFDYFKTGMEHGFENENVFILRYQDFQLEKAN